MKNFAEKLKRVLGVLSVVVSYVVLDGLRIAGELTIACPPAAIAAIIVGGAVLGGIAGSQAGRFEAPDKTDLAPNAFRFLTMPSAEGGLEFKQLAQDELAFLDRAINMQLFDIVGQRGAAEIKRAFEGAQDVTSRAAAFGIGPQTLQPASFSASQAAAVADFQAQLQKLNVGFAFEGVDRLNFLEQQAQAQLAQIAGAESIAAAQPSQTSQTISGLLAGASIGSSIAGVGGGGGQSPTSAAQGPSFGQSPTGAFPIGGGQFGL